MHILIIDDDPIMRKLISFVLADGGHQSSQASDLTSAMRLLQENPPHLVLLDIAMPITSGFEICREIRRQSDVPIIFLSVFGQAEDRMQGVQVGGDDYMVKPFQPAKLIARIDVVSRRSNDDRGTMHRMLQCGGISLNTITQDVTLRDQRTVALTPIEFRLLHYLMQHPGQILTFNQILSSVWGTMAHSQRQNLAAYIRRLRMLIEADADNPRTLTTVMQVGYRFEADEPHESRTSGE